jgi:hypothetical protein
MGVFASSLGSMLALMCFSDDPSNVPHVTESNDAGNAGDAQLQLDATSSELPDAMNDSSASAGHCAVPGQLLRAATGFCECPPRLPDTCPDACVDLRHDAEHCGDCDTRCEPGAGCRGGVCAEAPTEVAMLTGCVNPRMVLSGETFYFSDTGTGAISRLALSDTEVVEITTDQPMQDPTRIQRTSALAVQADALYWSNMGDNTLMKVVLSDGTPQALIELDAPARGLAVTADSVFFTHHADVFRIPSSGLSDAGAGTGPADLDCDDAGPKPVRGEPVAGATYVASSNESCSPNGQAAAIAVNESDVFYTIDVHGALSQNSQNGGAHLPLVLGDDVGPQRDVIVLNATHAFVAGYSSVLKATLGERASYEAVVNAVDGGIVTGFSITDTHVYVASDRGGISRASIDPPTDNSLVDSEQLVRDQDHPRWLANDGTHLYWIGDDCRIMSLEMPL